MAKSVVPPPDVAPDTQPAPPDAVTVILDKIELEILPSLASMAYTGDVVRVLRGHVTALRELHGGK